MQKKASEIKELFEKWVKRESKIKDLQLVMKLIK